MNKKFYIIEIYKKKNIFDVFGQEIKRSIEELGIKKVKDVKVSNLYKIECKADKRIIEKIAKELFIDKISDGFYVYKFKKEKKNWWIVEVYLKEAVTDPVGETAKTTIIESGILNQVDVKTGKKYYIKGDLNKEEIEEISKRILINPLIHNYFIKGKK
ncbi:MAG: phosphoribosylformylglycinamidine synthase subunit PurS [Candidatus Omnitrophica bacterium]|nr:phosphoribosylformylglycinamidine synthase subunit PurS [Candidatus Omnitrophota bacterium]